MNIVIVDDYAALSRAGADIVAALLATKPEAVLVVATGDTPMGVYRELAKRREQGALETAYLRAFQLDAYLGLASDDPRSLYGWMLRSFVIPLAIPMAHVVRLPGDLPDYEAACRTYDSQVASVGGFDLAILGLGPNGHLGFNEPPSGPNDPTRMVDLTPASIVSNARYWGGESQVPLQALTCGMDLLLAARQTLLVVSGAHKHTILHQMIDGPITPDVPASYLQSAANVTIIADQSAWEGRAF